ncbi:MAG: neutral/alkaline non-lysosomal ceramidase N-terminal domain-containing protein, partial [Planctomycetota bacterium]
MTRTSSTVLLILVCVLGTASAASSAPKADLLLAGVARIDITPQKPVKMSGYAGRTGLSRDVHDPLSARVVAFSSNGKRLVLVSTDFIGYYSGTADNFREVLSRQFDLEPSELFLTGIHTHAGPAPTLDEEEGYPNNVEYTRELKAKLVEIVGKALSKMEPVQVGTSAGSSPVGSNRRELVFDEAGNSTIRLGRNTYGVTDKEVLVMNVTRTNGRIVATLFDYAIHATCLGSKNYTISGDVLGLAEQYVEKILGPDVIAPAFAGASGNINPWYKGLRGFDTTEGWIPEPVLLGTMLGTEVVHVARDIRASETSGEIATAYATLELPGKRKGELSIADDCPPTRLNITVARVGETCFVGF